MPSQTSTRVASSSSTELQFGIPTFQPKKDDDDSSDKKEEKTVGLKGLAQLIIAEKAPDFFRLTSIDNS